MGDEDKTGKTRISSQVPFAWPGMSQGGHSPPVRLPLQYMIAGLSCFLLFACDLAWQVARGVLFAPGAPAGVALTHLLTLGALMSFVMGAVYQLSTVAFLMPIAAVRLAHFLFYAYIAGLAGLIGSFSVWWPPGMGIFGIWTAAVLYGFCGNMLASLVRARVRGPMWQFVFLAHVHLAIALAAAVVLALGDANLWPAVQADQAPVLATHILLAAGGFFGFLIFGFSYKLIPMFTLSHGYNTRYEHWAFWTSVAALWSLVACAWYPALALKLVSAICMVVAFLSHLQSVREILKRRVRKRIEAPIRGVLVALALGVLWALALIAHAPSSAGSAAWRALVPLVLMGFVSLTVISLAYKIVPFLVWTWRFASRQGAGSNVLISHLLDTSSARVVITLNSIGVVAAAAGIWLDSGWLCDAGAWAVAVSLGTFGVHMSSVFRRAWRKE
ncbi:hypothetical protein IW967_14855 [Alicyclobacillus mali]|uniref:Uncharacterized protein n=1 Tax=Alicyclobacillus mali (ex Roth et al. 2021) TaxID=1123961 RepID=A0ABS0F784_9BACL|nr:hypothetical protein [Alicyclobacillus mali (ex Roth et al. 2021)]MBF8379128.1 hypothetical protein [Alicyclobacillus mali (ex Roth et al. 2021)]MCL6489169.1 hypothetical protein [Alicyclobacillus mali (ex Roth et al. 2021)]